jgi:uncharacterized LabA/DUF88 family protein
MIKTAILIDGGWFCRILAKLSPFAGKPAPTAGQVVKNARLPLKPDETLYRIFFYDCPPFAGTVKNPITCKQTNYASSKYYASRTKFLHEIGQHDFVAMRLGELKMRGWNFESTFKTAMLSATPPVPMPPLDVYPNLEQKGVDMRIGIDVASLSLKRIVERIILLSGDTDLIPAMKLARREGLQVYVVEIDPSFPISKQLIEDSDGLRKTTPVL